MELDKIRFLLLDVDGVLTRGNILLDGAGGELKEFWVPDGSAVKWWHRAGGATGILSGRSSEATVRLAAELEVAHVALGAKVKLDAYRGLVRDAGFDDEEVCYVGDDFHDLPVMRTVGYSVAVAGAPEEVRDAANYVTERPGGRGAVREVVELLLRARGAWDDIVSRYTEPGEADK